MFSKTEVAEYTKKGWREVQYKASDADREAALKLLRNSRSVYDFAPKGVRKALDEQVHEYFLFTEGAGPNFDGLTESVEELLSGESHILHSAFR